MAEKQLFNRAVAFTDIHHGKKNNDREHNLDCDAFVDWVIEEGKAYEADACIFTGDWHDNRHSIHVSTLNHSLANMEKLANAFKHFYFIPGNHDLYYRQKREISSVTIGRNLDNITIINDFLHQGGVTFCPWLVGDEWKEIPKYAKKSKYMFGHFELPHFMMNAQVEMPDHGGLNHSHFAGCEWAFSGHFHARQIKENVCYIGNAFPHNFSDAWDDDRGMMLLTWGEDPAFKAWPDAPTYRTTTLTELLNNPQKVVKPKASIRITADIEVAFEEAQFIREVLMKHYQARKMEVAPGNKQEDQEFNGEVKFQSVDQIVIQGLESVESQTIDKKMLIQIYQSLA